MASTIPFPEIECVSEQGPWRRCLGGAMFSPVEHNPCHRGLNDALRRPRMHAAGTRRFRYPLRSRPM